MFRLLCIVLGYCFGCIQSAYIIGKIKGKMDIREFGSGNAGTTNMIRVMGWKAGIITFLGDFLKAVLAVILAKVLWGNEPFLAGIYAGLGVILGHSWPFYLKFKGGKGIASAVGILLALDFRIGWISIAVMLLIIAVTRYVSLASLLMTLLIPIQFTIFYYLGIFHHIEIIFIGIGIAALAWYRHRGNILRLVKGEESKLGQRSKKN